MTASTHAKGPVPDDVPELLEGWCESWSAADLAPEITVELSSRMTRSLGRCYPDRKLIRIARFVLDDSEDLFHEVLCHEAAHLAAYHLHGKSIRPHGYEWKSLMQQAGYPPSVRFKESRLQHLPPSPRRRVRRPKRKRWIRSVLEELQSALAVHTKSSALNGTMMRSRSSINRD